MGRTRRIGETREDEGILFCFFPSDILRHSALTHPSALPDLFLYLSLSRFNLSAARTYAAWGGRVPSTQGMG